MEHLDITTSHNIVVTVELANVSQRILATIIDGFIVGFYCIIISAVTGGSDLSLLLMLPILLCYHLIMEYFNNGQSLGKKLLKLRVVSLSGDRPQLLDLVMRWMFRTIDVTSSVGMLGIIFISSTKKKQRIGDILGNTTVVKQENDYFVSLKSIEVLSKEGYEVTYPQVVMYTDKDMLLVKDAMTRYKKKQTEENQSLVVAISQRILNDLKLKNQQGPRIDFLRTVLNDYIILTR